MPWSNDDFHTNPKSVLPWLKLIGWVSGLLVLFAGVARIAARDPSRELSNLYGVAEYALYIAAGLVSVGFFHGLSHLIRLLRDQNASATRLERCLFELNESSRSMATMPRSYSPASAITNEDEAAGRQITSGDHWEKVVTLLSDIRDNSLLSDEQRREKRDRVADEEIQNSQETIHRLIGEGDIAYAREITAAMVRKYPMDPRLAELGERVETAREQQESQDVVTSRHQVDDLISISAWSRAREVAQQLSERHPDSAEARELLLRIEREHRNVEQEQRRRMNAEVQRFVTRRRWEEALALAKTFIERFPSCEESEALRMELPTLETNAEIEIRQQLEAQIMDHARHGRYIHAAELARSVIEQFPGSPQADVLREQIVRLKELAENPDAPPARVRID